MGFLQTYRELAVANYQKAKGNPNAFPCKQHSLHERAALKVLLSAYDPDFKPSTKSIVISQKVREDIEADFPNLKLPADEK